MCVVYQVCAPHDISKYLRNSRMIYKIQLWCGWGLAGWAQPVCFRYLSPFCVICLFFSSLENQIKSAGCIINLNPPSRPLPPPPFLVSYHGGGLWRTTHTSTNNRQLGKKVSFLCSSGNSVTLLYSISTLSSHQHFTKNDQDWARDPLLGQEPANQIWF